MDSFRVREQGDGAVQVEAAFSAFGHRQVLQDLGLQRGTESFRLLDAVVLGGGLQFRERGDAEILIEPQHLLRPQTGYREHLEHALGNLLPQLFETGMTARLVKLGDDVGDRIPDARDSVS
ncbi:hypothetical protein GGD62_002815 [Bradyrhizobium sp. ERR14]|nr:hypothetical protein [Bradyrhizobium sp. ERR14]